MIGQAVSEKIFEYVGRRTQDRRRTEPRAWVYYKLTSEAWRLRWAYNHTAGNKSKPVQPHASMKVSYLITEKKSLDHLKNKTYLSLRI